MCQHCYKIMLLTVSDSHICIKLSWSKSQINEIVCNKSMSSARQCGLPILALLNNCISLHQLRSNKKLKLDPSMTITFIKLLAWRYAVLVSPTGTSGLFALANVVSDFTDIVFMFKAKTSCPSAFSTWLPMTILYFC